MMFEDAAMFVGVDLTPNGEFLATPMSSRCVHVDKCVVVLGAVEYEHDSNSICIRTCIYLILGPVMGG